RCQIAQQAFADRLSLAAQPLTLTLAALLLEPQVELVPRCKARDRHHEVTPGIADQSFNAALIWHGRADAPTSLPHFGGRRYGETIRDVGRREHASAGRPSERHGL